MVAAGQNDSPLHVNVFLVQLNIAVTDRKGNYVTGLRPEDFAIVEDKTIAEQAASFEEGKEPIRRLADNFAADTRPIDADGVQGRLGRQRAERPGPAIHRVERLCALRYQ